MGIFVFLIFRGPISKVVPSRTGFVFDRYFAFGACKDRVSKAVPSRNVFSEMRKRYLKQKAKRLAKSTNFCGKVMKRHSHNSQRIDFNYVLHFAGDQSARLNYSTKVEWIRIFVFCDCSTPKGWDDYRGNQ